MAAPRDFAFLLDAMGGLALERVDKIAVSRLARSPDTGLPDCRPVQGPRAGVA